MNLRVPRIERGRPGTMQSFEAHEGQGSRAWTVVYVAVTVAALYLARPVLIPIALAILLTFLLAPLALRLERWVRSRIAAVAIVTVLLIGAVGGLTALIGQQFVSLAEQLPTYRHTLVEKVRALRAGGGTVVDEAAETIRVLGDELKDAPPADETAGAAGPMPQPPPEAAPPAPEQTDALDVLGNLALPLAHAATSAIVVVLLLVLMLVSREGIRDRVVRLAGLRQSSLTTQALEEAGSRVGRYLRSQLLINSIYGAGVWAGLYLIGVPSAGVCGLMAGLLRFIPFLGPWLGAVIPVVLSLAVFNDWTHVTLVATLFVTLELINNIVLEPWWYGASTGLSSLGVVLAIIFWTWIWGAVGLVLAVPVTVCLVVFCRHIPHLGPLAILLADEPVLSEPVRFLQRLLVNNETDAAAILAATPADRDPAQALDEIVIPALAAARDDLARGLITPRQASRIATAARDVAWEWLEDRASAEPPDAQPGVPVACLPAADEFDECSAALLAQLLEGRGVRTVTGSASALLSENIALAQQSRARVVVAAAIGPGPNPHVRRLCKRLRRQLPGASLLTGEWGGAVESPVGSAAPDDRECDVRVVTLQQTVTTVLALAGTSDGNVQGQLPHPTAKPA